MAPRWIIRLLTYIVPDSYADEVVGDLEELHQRRRVHWGLLASVMTTVIGTGYLLEWGARRAYTALTDQGSWASSSDLRLALRLVRKQPVMTLTAVIALGTGIGLAAGGISLIRQVLYGEIPFENGDRFAVVRTFQDVDRRPASLTLERLRLFKQSASAIDYFGNTEDEDLNVVHANGEIERIRGSRMTAGSFSHLPYAPLLGRLLVPEDGAPGSPQVALIRESLWQRGFSAAPDIIGKPINIGGIRHTIVGILPNTAAYPNEGEIWIASDEEAFGAADDQGSVAGRIIAILAEGATAEQATAQLNQLSEQVSDARRGTEGQRHLVIPMARLQMSGPGQIAVMVSMGLLVVLLLVIAANVANLIVARTSRRTSELAVRSALGASRSRLVGQLFAEVLVIATIASVLGLALAAGLLDVYDTMLDELPFWVQLGLDAKTVGLVVVLALLASGMIGVIPALRATGKRSTESLRGSGRGGSLGVGKVGGAVIAVQVGISVALMGTAVVFAQGFQSYVDPAFHLPEERVLTARIDASGSELGLILSDVEESEAPVTTTVSEALRTALSGLSGVANVAFASRLPRESPMPEPLTLEGTADVVSAPIVLVGPSFFVLLDIQPILGRGFTIEDMAPEAPAVTLVNEAFALEHFGTTQVLGRALRRVPRSPGDGADPWAEIVGVVPNVMEVVGTSSGASGVYMPLARGRVLSVALMTDRNPVSLTGELRRAVFDLDPNLVITNIVVLEDVGAENRAALQGMGSAMTGIGVITLLLSLAGIYSIVSLAVTQRTREIGVRVALGARKSTILWSILRRSGFLIVVGAVSGAMGGMAMGNVRIFVFALPEPGPALYPAIGALMVLAGVLACWVPARRALSIHPVEALRNDS